MAYQRKSSRVIADAQERSADLRAIDPELDLGNNLTVAAYDTKIAEVQTALDAYNGLLAQADAAGNDAVLTHAAVADNAGRSDGNPVGGSDAPHRRKPRHGA